MSRYTKIITLDDHFPTGEPTIQIVSTWGRNGQLLREKTSCHKTAAHSPALDYIKTVEPEPGKTIVLIVGLGDHETYGPNRNGDGFPSEAVPGKISADETLPKHYKSYEKAHVFEHHVNSDPAKAIGRVKKAFWNEDMRRVEVLEDFDHKKAPHLLEKIAAGNYAAKSMGCFPSDTKVVTEHGIKDIQDIAVGDVLLTHRGNWKKVTELHRRPYIGKLYSVHTATGTSSATTEHPYCVLPASEVEEVRNYTTVRKPTDKIDLEATQWVPAEALEVGMYLVTPFDTSVEETLTVDQCRLLGYYGAEGYTRNGTSKGIILTHHVDDALTKEAEHLAGLFATSWTQVPRASCAVAMDTWLCGEAVYTLCQTHVGKYAHHKRLSSELMRQPKEQQLAFLGAYINGDGGAQKDKDFYISTCNKTLAYQLQQMGFRCGMYSKINTLRHKPSTIVKKNTVEYRVDFSRTGATTIAPYTNKIAAYTMRGPSSGPFFAGNTVVSKIKTIGVLDFDGSVYNFEVEDDNSFVADNHAVHNCRIKHDVCTNCGNKARTRAEYCDHLKYAMSQIDPHTGKQNAALNPSPVFFDSSWVVRPADRTGYMLKKVAKDSAYELSHSSFDLGELRDDLSHKAAALAKAADIEKILSGEPVASVSALDPADARLVERYSKECPHNTDPADSRAVQIMISYKPSEALGTADDMGLPLGIKDLVEYFLGRMTGKKDALLTDDLAKSASAHLKLAYTLFSRYPRFYSDLIKSAGLESRNTNVALAEKLAGLGTDYISRQIIPPAYRGNEERPLTDMISWTDPQTGRQYNTNYGTVRNTHDALTEQAFKSRAMTTAPLLGGSALLGAGALAMGLHPKLKGIPRLATGLGAVGLGALGVHSALRPLQAAGPKVLTDQGETISGWSEMVPKRASLSDTAPEIEYITKRANDATTAPLSDAYVEHFLNSIKTAEIYDELSDYVGPTLDLDRVAQALGNSILNRVV